MKLITLSLFIIVSLFACSPNQNYNDNPSSTGGIAIPPVIRAAHLGSGTLNAYVIVDGGTPQTMTINDTQDEASLQLGNLSVEQHQFTIVFEFDSDHFGVIELANAEKTLSLSSGPNTLDFLESDYNFPDNDADDVNNLTELEKVTNPNDANETPIIDNSPPVYMVYKVISSMGQTLELGLVDPANPQQTKTLVTGQDRSRRIPFGQYNATEKLFIDVHYARIVYFSAGRIYIANLVVNDTEPTGRLLSTAEYTDICDGFFYGADFNNPDNTRILYSRPDGGGCSSAVWEMVKVGMGETDDPIPAQEIEVALIDPADGSSAGWLGLTGGNLVHYSPDFDTSNDITNTVTIDSIELLGDLPNGKIILGINNLNNDTMYTLHIFDTTTKILSNPYFTSSTSYSSHASDPDYFFFEHENSIYRLDLNSPGTPSVMYTEDPAASFSGLFQTNTYLIYQATIDTTTSVKYFSKNAAPAVTPQTAFSEPSGNNLTFAGSSTTRIYFNKIVPDTEAEAISVNIEEDSVNLSTNTNSQWILVPTIPSTFSGLFAKPDILSLDSPIAVEYMMLAGYDETQTSLKIAGKSLKTYRAQNGLLVADLGTFPSNTRSAIFYPFYFGTNILISASMEVDSGSQNDIFYADVSSGNSLSRSTDTTDINEHGCTINPNATKLDPTFIILVAISVFYLTRKRKNSSLET